MAYQLLQRLGRGGMGVVDLAVDEQGRQFALKRLVLHGSALEMERARQRVRREAEALGRLDHPGVVGLIEVIEHDDEIVLVMPYLSGGTLADHVRTRGPLSPAQVEVLADSLLDALASAHRVGVVHRDIKPANVLFDAEGRAMLADFGVASFRDATSGLTATGSLIGTPDYMAPEQARGEPATPASDVFALGATLLYAATGQPPYGRADPRITVQRAAKGKLAPTPAPLDRDLRARLNPLLRRDPTRRPTAAAAAGGPAGTAIQTGRSRRVSAWAVAGIVLAVLAGLGAVALAANALRGTRIDLAGAEPTGSATTASTSAPCSPKPYQPCGQPAAPHTDGSRCLANHDDYDGDPTNGCEATADTIDGQTFDATLTANLVPRDDTDSYPTPVADHFHLLCDGAFQVTLTAPAGTSMQVSLSRDGKLLDQATSQDGRPAKVVAHEQDCFGSDAGTLTTTVSWVGDARSAAPYRLERQGAL